MSRTFGYCRVSTKDQNTQDQQQEMWEAGFAIEPHRIIEEIISGSVAAKERPGFLKLLNKIESGDVLVVTRIDKLGRNAMDVRVHCLALGGVDLTSPTGKMIMGIIASVAEFEQDMLNERNNADLIGTRKARNRIGRKPALDDD
jgi:putative DNA-invertase from lambdoid prophage Rac